MLDISDDLLKKTCSFQVQKGSIYKSSPFLRNKKLTQLFVNYRFRPIIFDERFDQADKVAFSAYGNPELQDQPIRAGDRAPDAPELAVVGSSQVYRMFDLFDAAKHLVLVFTGQDSASAGTLVESAVRYPRDFVRTIVVHPAEVDQPVLLDEVLHVVDKEGHAYNSYLMDPNKPTIVVIRPDTMVGGVAISIEWMKKYFSGIVVA